MSKMTRSEAGRLGALKVKQLWRDRYADSPKQCKQCKKDLPYEQRFNKFCGHSCAASHNNLGWSRNSGTVVRSCERKKQVCKLCEAEIPLDKYYKDRKYCSNKCQFDHQWQLRKNKIAESGEESSPKRAKRYLREVRGDECEICGTHEWRGQPVPLVLDHIDGNSEDNRINNLRLVCGNCDMQLPTYKGKNMGNGRSWRRKRYQEGKSY